MFGNPWSGLCQWLTVMLNINTPDGDLIVQQFSDYMKPWIRILTFSSSFLSLQIFYLQNIDAVMNMSRDSFSRQMWEAFPSYKPTTIESRDFVVRQRL
jgi:hypothetical protein